MGRRTLLINCGCEKKLCRKAVRMTTKTDGGPVQLTILDNRRPLGTITLAASRALTVVQWILVVPQDAQRIAWKLLSKLKE